ncbi:MAG TPA: DNA repair protein RecO [Hyphomicrobiaceae bacterium]|jgi:DNA repair protein RecO (recombination protein O)|nr:DNA repair protein RecO [Hyphomicrobiaceae bacterium]
MNWSDQGIIVSVRPHGETAAIVEVLTREHGRHAGLVYGGRSRRLRPVLQIGNHIEVTWKGRLAEHLGFMTVELRKSYAASAMDDAVALAGLASMCALTRLLPERDPHPSLYDITLYVLGFLSDAVLWPALYVRWELALLADLGFGLELSACASTSATEDLVYVSPRSGRAVSAGAGAPYRDRLLQLPMFLKGGCSREVTRSDVLAGLALTGHFLEARILRPRGFEFPDARQRLNALLARAKAI